MAENKSAPGRCLSPFGSEDETSAGFHQRPPGHRPGLPLLSCPSTGAAALVPDRRAGTGVGGGQLASRARPAPRRRRMKTPASLLERMRQPANPDAWERFVALYAPLIYSWGCRAGLQDADAADLVQEVLVALMRRPAHLRLRPAQELPPLAAHHHPQQVARPPQARRPAAAAGRRRAGGRCQPRGPRRLLGGRVPPPPGGPRPAGDAGRLPAGHLEGVLGVRRRGPAGGGGGGRAGPDGGRRLAARFRVLDRLRQELAGLLD